MTSVDEIESKLLQIQIGLNKKDGKNIFYHFSSDIKHLRPLIEKVKDMEKKFSHEILEWLIVLLSNPFKLPLKSYEIDILQSFLLNKFISYKYLDKTYKCLALLIDRTNSKYYIKDNLYFINDYNVSQISYYRFLYEMSKIQHLECEKINKNEMSEITTLKIKIYSNGCPKKALETYFSMINDSNTKIGWDLCRCFVKVCKKIDIDPVIKNLKKICSEIFANESTWINVTTIFGMMLLNKWEIGDIEEIIVKSITYDNEVNFKSENLRESGMFLLWSLVRTKGNISKNVLELTIGIALFDSSLLCRRAAATIIFEYVGKNSLDYGQNLISLINFDSVKRYFNSLKCFEMIKKRFSDTKNINKMLINGLSHYKYEKKEISSMCLAKNYAICEDIKLFISECSSLTEYIGLMLLIQNFYSNNRQDEIEMGVLKITNIKINDQMVKEKDFKVFAEEYTKTIIIISPKNEAFCSNVYFLVNKNICPESTAKCSWLLIKLSEKFSLKIFQLLKKNNEAIIFSNAKNKKYEKEVKLKYIENLKNNDIEKKTITVKSIRNTNFDVTVYKNYILEGLNNYYCDYRGDIGSKLRKECILVSFNVFDDITPALYFTRFFVDKSKMLRDECVLISKNCGILNLTLPHIKRFGEIVNKEKLIILKAFLTSYNNFYLELEKENLLGNDKKHFKAAIESAHLLPEIYYEQYFIGIINSICYSDASLSSFILENTLSQEGRNIKYIGKALDMKYGCHMVYPVFALLSEYSKLKNSNNLKNYTFIIDKLIAIENNTGLSEKERTCAKYIQSILVSNTILLN